MKAAIGGHAGPAGDIDVVGVGECLENPLLLSGSALADELLVQLGLEYFSIGVPLNVKEARAAGAPSSTYTLNPTVGATTSEPRERAFWDDVAALTGSGVVLSPNAWGAKPDVVTYAIATVAARYTTPPPTVTAVPAVNAQPVRAGTPTTPSVSTQQTREGKTRDTSTRDAGLDFETVLESFFDFELDAGLKDVVGLELETFDKARRAAAAAVLANYVVRDTALKAALGQKG